MPTINFSIPNDLNIGGNLYIQGTLITGGGGGGGGSVIGSGIPTLNGLSGVLNIVGTGGLRVSTAGQNILVSGDQSISGYVNSVSGGLQAQIAGGGTQVKISGSSTLSTADFTGLGGTLVFSSGGKIFVSGAGGGGGGNVSGPASSTSGNVALWDGTNGRLLMDSTASVLDGVSFSAGPADSGKIPLLNASGKFDPSFITGVSVGGGSSGIPTLNGLSGALTIVGTGGLTVTTASQRIVVSGDYSKVSGPVSSTDNRVALWDGASGRLLKDSNAFAISGITSSAGPSSSGMIPLLNASGKFDPSFITGVSAGGASSGIPTINGLSGALNIVGTGGITIFPVGQNILISGDQSVSGYVRTVSGALQALIAGGGSQVRITGSSTLSIADFTGIGGAIVFSSGGQVFISGGAGGGGGTFTPATIGDINSGVSNTLGVTPLGLAGLGTAITVVSRDGTSTHYTSPQNSNKARGSGLITVVGNAVSGDTIFLSAQYFDLGFTGIQLPGYVNLRGAGQYSTTILSQVSNGVVLNMACIAPGTGSELSDFTLLANATGVNGGLLTYQAPFGFDIGGNGVPSFFTARRVYVSGDSDAFYVKGNAASPCIARIYDSVFRSNFDAAQILNFTGANSSFEFYNCNFSAIGPSLSANPGIAAAFAVRNAGTNHVSNTQVKLYGGAFFASGANQNYGLDARDTAGPGFSVELHDVSITTIGGSTTQDIKLTDFVTVDAYACRIDENKLSVTATGTSAIKIHGDLGLFVLTGTVPTSTSGQFDARFTSVSGYVNNISGILSNTVTPIAKGGTNSTTAVAARAALNVGETALTWASTIATDASLGNVFKIQLTGNATLGNPTNLQAGATYMWKIQQDISGKRTLAYNSAFKFPSGLTPTLTTGVSGIDILSSLSDGTNVYSTFMPDFR